MTKRANRTLAFLATMSLLTILLAVLVVVPAGVYADQEDQPVAFAVYDADADTLSFHKQMTVPEKGSTFTGSDGVTRTASAVYEGIETTEYGIGTINPEWVNKDKPGYEASQVIIVDEISPVSTSGWFLYQRKITSLDLRNLNTVNVTNMARMFLDCSSLTSLDVSMLRTENVTDMRGMFSGCSSLTSLDLSNFRTSNVTQMNTMFQGCSSITAFDLRSFETSKLEMMPAMFKDCSSVEVIDLSSFDNSSITGGLMNIFDNCVSLTTIYAGEKWLPNERFDRAGNNIFLNCNKLVGCLGSTIDRDDPLRLKPKYMRIDGGPDRPGYMSTHKKSLAAVKVSGIEMFSVLCTDTVGPTPTLMDGDKLLELGVDYTTSFSPRSERRNAALVMVGAGNYEGFIKKEFATLYILTPRPQDTRLTWSRDREQMEEETAINAPIVLKSDSPISNFLRFLLNGKVVGPEHYDVKEGSTIVELHEDFLESLKPGTYVAAIESSDQTVAAELTIEAEEGYVDPDPGSNPYAPDDPEDPENPDDPSNPDNPDDPKPVNPDKPTPSNPDDPGNPNKPGPSGSNDSDAPSYAILDGAEGSYVRGSGEGLVVRSDGAIDKLVALLVDGTELKTPDHYTIVSGSTIATLQPAYLDTLPAGEHTLTFRYVDGDVSTKFTVNEADSYGGTAPINQVDITTGTNNGSNAATNQGGSTANTTRSGKPNTGDNSMVLLWSVLLLVGALSACKLHRARKRV